MQKILNFEYLNTIDTLLLPANLSKLLCFKANIFFGFQCHSEPIFLCELMVALITGYKGIMTFMEVDYGFYKAVRSTIYFEKPLSFVILLVK